MKKLVVALAALALAAPAFAQTAAQQSRPQLGLGISINPEAAFSSTFEVYVPFQVAPELRLEPSLGIFTQDTDGVDASNITLGLGVFVMQRLAPAMDMYYGGRLKLNFASFDDGFSDESGTDISLAGAIGGEYYLAPRFSIGLEGQLGFYSLSDANGDGSGFFTTGLGFLRMYF